MTFRDAFFDELTKTAMNPMAMATYKPPTGAGAGQPRTINVPGSSKPVDTTPQIKPATERANHVAQFKQRVRTMQGKRPWYTKPWALAGGGALAGIVGSRMLSRRDDE